MRLDLAPCGHQPLGRFRPGLPSVESLQTCLFRAGGTWYDTVGFVHRVATQAHAAVTPMDEHSIQERIARLDEYDVPLGDVFFSIATAVQEMVAFHQMPWGSFVRLIAVGQSYELPIASAFLPIEPLLLSDWEKARQMSSEQVGAFARELESVRRARNDALLDKHLSALLDLANRMLALPRSVSACMHINLGEAWGHRWY